MEGPKRTEGAAEEWFDRTRRQLLTGSATAGALAAAGCSGSEPREGVDPTEAASPSPTTAVTPPDDDGRVGNVVYYAPNDGGPYTDLEAAVADVPQGGTLVLTGGRYDVATEGRIVPKGRSIHVRGSGWTRKREPHGENVDYNGTVLVNTGEDTIDDPVIDYALTQGIAKGATLRDFAVLHEGPSSPAIRMADVIFSEILTCAVSCRLQGQTGILFDGSGYYTRCLRSQVEHATDISVHVSGQGYAHEFYSNQIRSNVDGCTAAFQTEVDRTIVAGGQCSTKYARPDDPAIRFYNPGNRVLHGGLVLEPGIETTMGVDIDGRDEPFADVQLYHTKAAMGGNQRTKPRSGTHVRFGNAVGCKLVYPIVWDRGALPEDERGQLVEWTSDAEHCGVITDANTLQKMHYTDQGATNPYVHVTGGTTEEQLAGFPTGVPTKVSHAISRNSALYHDGETWLEPATDLEPTTPRTEN
jgi:hypothetical protein